MNTVKAPASQYTPVLRCLAIASLTALLLACSSITTHKTTGEEVSMTQEEFEKYVEKVFRYHNQVMNDLIETATDRASQTVEESRKLDAAEARMVTMCRILNEIVAESMSGENPGFKLKLDLIDSVPACEAASKTVDDLIP